MAAAAGAAGAAAAKRLAEAAARIFGTVVNVGNERSGRKLLSRPLIGEKVASYYGVKPLGLTDPLYEDPMDEYRRIKLSRLRRRGKSPPKKGQGKRASKR